MRFQPEPPYAHGQAARTAILLCNLGTPDAPTASALRRYLKQFLSDPRVVEIARPLWWLILNGIILQTRPRKSAAKYASIWTPEGSPLWVWTQKQATLLQDRLGEAGHQVLVRPAMRYGNPSISSQLDALKAEGATRILILPLYPQYSAPTTASVGDAVYAWAAQIRNVPELRFVNHYHDDAGYINALARSIETYWKHNGPPDKLVMSFHGVPEFTLTKGDPYHCESLKTARLLAERMGLHKDDYQVTFQSRFGKAKWLEPYTEPTLVQMADAGIGRVDVICPGFTCDCLETLEEINHEVRNAFLGAGGKEFHYIPCLNDSPVWMGALSRIALQHLGGWPTQLQDDAALAVAQAQALAGGAPVPPKY